MPTLKELLQETVRAMIRSAVHNKVASGEALVAPDAIEVVPVESIAAGKDEDAAVGQIEAALEAAVAEFPGIENLTEAEVKAAFDAAFEQVVG